MFASYHASGFGAGASIRDGVVHRLVALHRSRRSLDDLAQRTNQLARSLEADTQAVNVSLQPITARLRMLSVDPTAGGMSLADGQRTFQELLARARLTGAILPPLTDESALVRRYGRDLAGGTRRSTAT